MIPTTKSTMNTRIIVTFPSICKSFNDIHQCKRICCGRFILVKKTEPILSEQDGFWIKQSPSVRLNSQGKALREKSKPIFKYHNNDIQCLLWSSLAQFWSWSVPSLFSFLYQMWSSHCHHLLRHYCTNYPFVRCSYVYLGAILSPQTGQRVQK